MRLWDLQGPTFPNLCPCTRNAGLPCPHLLLYDLDCPPGLQLPLVLFLVSRGEEVSVGVQVSRSPSPSIGTAAAWRGKWFGLRTPSPHYRTGKEGWSLLWSGSALVLWTWSPPMVGTRHLGLATSSRNSACAPRDGFVMGTEVGAMGRALGNVHSQFKLKEQFKAIYLHHKSFF